jgi:hypothetical protein
MSTGTVVANGGAQVPDEEWFGEGSAFDSGEDLAAALFALAGVAHSNDSNDVPLTEVAWPIISVPEIDPVFEEVQRPNAVADARRPYSPQGRTTATSAAPRNWSVRTPGDALLPPTVSGRSGWTIRNSVAVLHRTEDAIAKLREEAVAMAFLAAAEACGRGRPASLERRKHPR